MKRTGIIRRIAATLACAGFISGQAVQAASPMLNPAANQVQQTATAQQIRDVGLSAGGVLRGQVVDSLGTAKAGSTVIVVKNGQVAGTAKTDATGAFEVAGLSGGVYQIQTEQGGGNYRLWAPRTAPPAASDSALIVNSNDVMLGQDRPIMSWLSNPWVLGGLVAAAIAIPLALDHDSGS